MQLGQKIVPHWRSLDGKAFVLLCGIVDRLEDRRLTYKILSGFEKIPSYQFLQLQCNGYCTRGHNMKLQVQRSTLDTWNCTF